VVAIFGLQRATFSAAHREICSSGPAGRRGGSALRDAARRRLPDLAVFVAVDRTTKRLPAVLPAAIGASRSSWQSCAPAARDLAFTATASPRSP